MDRRRIPRARTAVGFREASLGKLSRTENRRIRRARASINNLLLANEAEPRSQLLYDDGDRKNVFDCDHILVRGCSTIARVRNARHL